MMVWLTEEQESYLGITTAQFRELHTATLICSGLSLVICLSTVLIYAILSIFYRRHADRVSLRFVFLSTIANSIKSVMSIVIVSDMDNDKSCLPAGVVFMFFSMLSTGFLTAVGINLLLVFVRERQLDTRRLQIAYFCSVVVYSLLSASVPIKFMYHPCIHPKGDFSCWFDVYYEHSRCGNEVWIWHFSFLMLLVVIAFGCSVTATSKLLRQQSRLGNSVGYDGTRTQKQDCLSLITKVVLRCILYPLVPFIASIWGFVAQTLVFINGFNAPYVLIMFAVVFQSMEGVLVAIIFYTDPTVTTIVSNQFRLWCRLYVEEYKRINIPRDLSAAHLSLYVMTHCEKCKRESSGSDYPTDAHLLFPESPRTKTVPVRCITIPSTSLPRASETDLPPPFGPRVIYRLSSHNPHQLESAHPSPLPNPLLILDHHPDKTKMYMPYRYPRIAAMVNCLLGFVTSSPDTTLFANAVEMPLPGSVEIGIVDTVDDADLLRPSSACHKL